MATAFVRVLGAVRFVDERGEVVDLPSAAQRRLLAALALANGATLRSEYLCDALDLTSGSLRTTVSRVRSRIGDGVIRTDSAGYRMTCAVDATMFSDLLVDRSDRSDRPDRADRLAALDGALALWQGEALDEFRHEPWAAPEVARLDELRALAVEDRAELLIARGRAEEAVAALEPHVVAHPLRDRPRGLLMQALASCGRQADALRAFQAYRAFLAEETGTEPSALVRSIERRVAAGWDDADDAPDGVVPPRLGRRDRALVVEVPLPGELAEAPELIGRRRELTWLDSDLVAARSGSLCIALIGGEAGIGKTTMLAAFARAHLEAGNVVAFGRCDEGEAVPLEPLGGIVADLVEHLPLGILQEHAERCGGELLRVAPRLGSRLWVPPPVTSDVASERHHLFDAITDLLRRVAWAGSLTLILDDLHWAEPSALHLLRHLSRSLADATVLVIAGYRDAPSDSTPELRAALADLDRGRCRSISLGGFDDAELGRLYGPWATLVWISLAETTADVDIATASLAADGTYLERIDDAGPLFLAGSASQLLLRRLT